MNPRTAFDAYRGDPGTILMSAHCSREECIGSASPTSGCAICDVAWWLRGADMLERLMLTRPTA